jgi:hypothetical protein
LFCYKCGASIVSNPSAKVKKGGRKKTSELIEQALKKEEISNVWFQDKIVEKSPDDQINTELVEERIEAEFVEEKVEIKEEVSVLSTPNIREKAKLESAASMRQKAKTIQKNRIEVVWEKSETSNIWFIFGTVLFAAFAFGVVFIAWTIR